MNFKVKRALDEAQPSIVNGDNVPVEESDDTDGLLDTSEDALIQLSLDSGTIVDGESLLITSSDPTVSIHFTLDGTDPTPASPIYVNEIVLEESVTLKVVAVKEGAVISEVLKKDFVVQVKKITSTVTSGTYTSPQLIDLATTSSDAAIHYTTDGSTPTSASPVYSGALNVNATTTIKAVAIKPGLQDSEVLSITITITQPSVATPTFLVAGGNYKGEQSVAIATTTSGAAIHYTLDGSTPDENSTLYTAAETISETTTVKAIAIAAGYNDSAVATATYTIQVEDVTSTVATGTYTSAQSVELSTDTTGATIRYTTNGDTPTAASTAYSSAWNVSASTTIKAIAFKSGLVASDMLTVTLTINSTPVADPVFSVTGGTYGSSQSVSITTTTSGAAIYYTTDGSTPDGDATLYDDPIEVSSSMTIKAIAIKADWPDSDVVSESYTINVAAIPTEIKLVTTPVIMSNNNFSVSVELLDSVGSRIDSSFTLDIAVCADTSAGSTCDPAGGVLGGTTSLASSDGYYIFSGLTYTAEESVKLMVTLDSPTLSVLSESILVGEGGWGTSSAISAAGVSAYTPEVAIAANGDAVVVWGAYLTAGTRTVYVSERRNGGGWSAPASVGTATSNTISLAINGRGETIVVWHDGSDISIHEYFNDVWTTSTGFSGTLSAEPPTVAIDNKGDALIAWRNTLNQPFMSERRNGIWDHPTGAEMVFTFTTITRKPAVAMGNDAAIVGWISSGRAYKSEHRDGSWTHPAATGDAFSTIATGDASVAMSEDGSALISWRGIPSGTDQRIFIAEFRNNSWTMPGVDDYVFRLDGAADLNVGDPRIAMDNEENAVAAWAITDMMMMSESSKVYVSHLNGSTGIWSHPANYASPTLVADDSESIDIRVAIGGGHGLVGVRTGTAEQTKIFKSELLAGSWVHPNSAQFIYNGNSGEPRVAVNSSGEAILAWIQEDSGSFRVFMIEYGP